MNRNRIVALALAALSGTVFLAMSSPASAWRECGAFGRPKVGGQEADWVSESCSMKNYNAAARTLVYPIPVESSTIAHTATLRGQGSSGFSGRFYGVDQNGVIQFTNSLVSSTSSTAATLSLGTITPLAGQGCGLYVEATAQNQSVIHQITWGY